MATRAGRGRRWLLAAVLLSLVLRAPFLQLPMISDEGGYAYVAQRWLDGRGHLYEDIWVSRPQGIFVSYGIIQNTLGGSAEMLRLGAWLASVLTLVFVWRYAREWAGRGTAAMAAVIFAAVAAAPTIEGFTANAEVFMALPSAIVAWLLLGMKQSGWPRRYLFLIGALAGLATLLKPSGIVMLPVAVAFAWLEGAATPRTATRRSGWIVAGFAAAVAPALVHGWLIGWGSFFFAAVGYRLAYQNSLTVGPTHHLAKLGWLSLDAWWMAGATLVPVWGRRRAVHQRLIGGLPGGIRGYLRTATDPANLRRRVRTGGHDPGGTLLRLWLLGCVVGMAMGGDWWAHYLIQIAGPMAIGLAVLVRDAAPAVAPYRRLAFGAAVGLLLLVPYRVVAVGGEDARSLALFGNTSYPNHDDVAAYLREHTPPETTIFVAFNDAALYYLADRPSTYRYFFNQELLAFPDSQAQLVAMIKSPYRPEIVVRTGMPAPYPDRGQAFWDAVEENYRVRAVVDGATIYRAIESPVSVPPDR